MSFVPAQEHAWRSSLTLTTVLGVVVLVPRLGTRFTPALSALGAAFLVENSGLLVASWSLPGFPGLVWTPGLLFALLIGAIWVMKSPADSGQGAWDITVFLVAVGLMAWVALTTGLLWSQNLVEPRANASYSVQGLVVLTLLAGTFTIAGRSPNVRRRVGCYVLALFLVGIIRVVI